MKQELQQKLYQKYPKILIQKHLPMQQTAMCWGISCGDGWYDIIDTLCFNIQARVKSQEIKDPSFVCQATQVKEKFGGLRFYIYGGDDYIEGLIEMAEDMSYKICSECGNKSEQPENQSRGWIYTLCTPCKNKT